MMNKQPPQRPSIPGRIIPVDAYPPMLRKSQVTKAAFELRSERLKQHAGEIIATSSQAFRAAVLECITTMEEAGRNGDVEAIFAQAHEIRGMATTAGLSPVVAVIANGLCRYLDAAQQAGLPSDLPLVLLHLDAIVRATHATDDGIALGSVVAQELAFLVAKKLDGVKE